MDKTFWSIKNSYCLIFNSLLQYTYWEFSNTNNVIIELKKNRDGYITLPYTMLNDELYLQVNYLLNYTPLTIFRTNGTVLFCGDNKCFPKVGKFKITKQYKLY